MFCTQCGHNLSSGANYCPKCGTEIGQNQNSESKDIEAEKEKSRNENNKGAISFKPNYNIRPRWKLALLLYSTFNLYQIYWLYRNWSELKKEFNLDISPGLRTLGLFVPLLNIYLWYDHFKLIKEKAKESGIETSYSPGLLTVLFLIGVSLIQAKAVPGLISFVIAIFLPFVFFPAQTALNEMWTNLYPKAEINKGLDTEVMVAVGFFILVLLLVFSL